MRERGVNVCILHVGQGDLGDRGQGADGVQGVLGEVGHCAQVCVQQTPWDLQRVLPGLAESFQGTQPSCSLDHPGQLQLHSAASHALKQTGWINCFTVTNERLHVSSQSM